ncbi:hypothetical protein HMPREF3187_00646, partial [Aerococcus christensenii]
MLPGGGVKRPALVGEFEGRKAPLNRRFAPVSSYLDTIRNNVIFK